MSLSSAPFTATISAAMMENFTVTENYTAVGSDVGGAKRHDDQLAFRSFLVLAMVLAVGGLLINVVTLATICAVRMKLQWLRLSLASLCAADACTCVVTLALTGIQYHYGTEDHNQHLNSVQHRIEYCLDAICRFAWDTSTSASMYTLLLMAAQLFASIRWPLRSGSFLSVRAAAAMLAIVWVAAASVGFSPAMLVAVSAQHEKLQQWREKVPSRFCYQLILYKQLSNSDADAASSVISYKYPFGQQLHVRVHLLVSLGATAAALVTLVGTYVYVLTVVRAKVKLSGSQQRSGSSDGSGATTREKRLAILAALITCLFLAGYLPLYTFVMIASFQDGGYDNSVTFSALMALATLSPITDPLLYCLRLKEIRTGLRGALWSATRSCRGRFRRRGDDSGGDSGRVQSAYSTEGPSLRPLLSASPKTYPAPPAPASRVS